MVFLFSDSSEIQSTCWVSIVLLDVLILHITHTRTLMRSASHVRIATTEQQCEKRNCFLQIFFQPTCDFYAKLMLRLWLEWTVSFRFENESALQTNYTHTYNLAQISSQFHRWYSKLFAYSLVPFYYINCYILQTYSCEIELQINVWRWWQRQRPHTLTKPAQTKNTHKRPTNRNLKVND